LETGYRDYFVLLDSALLAEQNDKNDNIVRQDDMGIVMNLE
jgi:hypothetical protein